MKQLDRK